VFPSVTDSTENLGELNASRMRLGLYKAIVERSIRFEALLHRSQTDERQCNRRSGSEGLISST
jgi:hypothetical protein